MNAGLPEAQSGPSTRTLIIQYTACYLLLIVYIAATMWLLFSLRDNLVGVSLVLQVNPWALRAIDRFGILLLGLAWLMIFIVIESYLRNGIHKRLFWRRIGKTFLIVGLVFLASQALNWLLRMSVV